MRREFQFAEKKMRLKFMLKGCCSIFIPTLLKIVMKKIHFLNCVWKRDSSSPGRLMFPSRLRCFKLRKLDGSA